MREIKFRVWYIHKNEMVTDCRLGEMDEENDGWGHFMQYTGLEDKNGVEIYEGDIARYRQYSNTIVGEIKYRDKFASFMIYNEHFPNTNMRLNMDIEVIGNIYENPELLK